MFPISSSGLSRKVNEFSMFVEGVPMCAARGRSMTDAEFTANEPIKVQQLDFLGSNMSAIARIIIGLFQKSPMVRNLL